MDIQNDTNISNLISNSISKLNLNSKQPTKNQALNQTQTKAEINDFKKEDSALIENNKPINKIDVQDIQKYALELGETLTIEDINYGLMYGRSVIADYSA